LLFPEGRICAPFVPGLTVPLLPAPTHVGAPYYMSSLSRRTRLSVGQGPPTGPCIHNRRECRVSRADAPINNHGSSDSSCAARCTRSPCCSPC